MPPILIVPIAPSGSGKSTLYESLHSVNFALHHFSWDLLRLKYYSPDYGIAWHMYQHDVNFFDRALNEFKQAVVRREDIYIDNMNLTVASREQFVKLATVYGYRKIAYYFDVPFDELYKRHEHFRAKNKVRLSSYELMNQCNKQQRPHHGEFDYEIHLKWLGNKYEAKHVTA